jgi:sugar/nucleoside kinase (ribokinase family)
MATYLGAAVELSAQQISHQLFAAYDHLHLEGYLVLNQELMESALEITKQCGMTASIDLASYNVVETNLDFLKKIIARYKPVIFANEEEARAFTGLSDPHRSLDVLSSLSNTAIVKIGAKGSLICHEKRKYAVSSIPVDCIDTTGAGDLYAAGYLFGYVNDLAPGKCGRIGSLLAGKVIEEAGAKISQASWEGIHKILLRI